MKTFIFWKLINGKKVTVETITGYYSKQHLKELYKDVIDFDGIDSVI